MAVGVLTNINYDPRKGKFTAIFTADGTPSASGIYCGFIPKTIRMTQVGGSPDNTSRTMWGEGLTAGYYVRVVAAGDLTIQTSNGYTQTTGGEATVVAKATNSPNASGPGFTIGTGPQAASLVYYLEAES